MTPPRPLIPAAFDVSGNTLVVADVTLPVAAEFDSGSGAFSRAFTWNLVPDLRGLDVARDVAITKRQIAITSPAAGGVVIIDRASARITVIPLEAPPQTVIPDGDAFWVVAERHWSVASDPRDVAATSSQGSNVWRNPTDEELHHFGGMSQAARSSS